MPAKKDDKPEVKEVAKETGYFVADGKALTSKRGILGAGAETSVKDFSSKEAFDGHVKNGTIVKK